MWYSLWVAKGLPVLQLCYLNKCFVLINHAVSRISCCCESSSSLLRHALLLPQTRWWALKIQSLVTHNDLCPQGADSVVGKEGPIGKKLHHSKLDIIREDKKKEDRTNTKKGVSDRLLESWEDFRGRLFLNWDLLQVRKGMEIQTSMCVCRIASSFV